VKIRCPFSKIIFLEDMRLKNLVVRNPARKNQNRVNVLLILFLSFALTSPAADESTTADILKRLQMLEQKQVEYEKLLKQRDDHIKELESNLSSALQQQPAQPAPTNSAPEQANLPVPGMAINASNETQELPSANKTLADKYTDILQPNYGGFKLAETPWGELNFRLYTYARYLNQLGLDPTYTDAFGRTREVDRRNDIMLQKVQLQFLGWIYDPSFNYFLWIWTSNPTMGQGSQVVVAGTISYTVNEHLTLGTGVRSLPATRTLEGSFPLWLKVDSRTMADEFFRGSYTFGIWGRGEITKGLNYQVMLGNNLSALGVDAAQLDNKLQTVSSALVWMPTTGEFGPASGFGDLEFHEKAATRTGLHFTYSNEDRQSQPNSEDPENSQIRLSDGTGLFDRDAFGVGTQVERAHYQMASFDAGLKYRGFSLEGEYYLRWITDLTKTGPVPFSSLFDHGFQLQMSYMVRPTWQLYTTTSKIFGEFGSPWDASLGVNWYPIKRKGFQRQLRVNGEAIYIRKSPTGGTSYPFIVGANGPIFMLNVEFFF
jgi:hypothetical protein